ncbi:MAG: endonuclease/exonuclease/phosphatase family protein [Rothia sp. (in: high G+C Gram-positive bacteria)]|uniref:endonuclease/exonuclease/phosphatase family protein n=1 Tax=Rothia sp. (in: high G+C Gram-positive bacteria) TaxID=1885016 RepID=UPI0026DA8087|nr:endonuclease/exonuclease/phosphatase family protein [Rothia sp. (in: high G+C Gram-positive bacteria)]MDO4884326.1 endonuclease/exonuclease/phosphatase family protein [Rothia sp. (in: high G+C Gram-positive bacteria)]
MLFLTLNTHSWLEEHQVAKVRELALFIAERGVDIIALQEVNQYLHSPIVGSPPGYRGAASIPVREDNYALVLVRFLAELGVHYEWAFAEAHLGWNRYDECVAVLSRLPIERIEPVVMSPQYGYDRVERRSSLAVQVRAEAGPVWCVSAHMSWWNLQGEPLFEREFTQLSRALAEYAQDAPILLGGDFNAEAQIRGEGYDLVLSSGVVDTRALAEHTDGEFTVHRSISGWEGHEEAKRIDFVFADRPVRVLSHAVVFRDDSPEAISDHSGVLVEVDPASFAPNTRMHAIGAALSTPDF